MGWIAGFRTALGNTQHEVQLELVFKASSTPAWTGAQPTNTVTFASHGTEAVRRWVCLSGRCQQSGAVLDPVQWKIISGDALQVEITSEAAMRDLLSEGGVRGMTAELTVKLGTLTAQRVFFGRVQNVTKSGRSGAARSVWTVTIYGFQAMMQSRMTTTTARTGLFYNAGTTTTTTTVYTAGSSTSLTLTDASKFERESTSGAPGIIRVAGPSGDFYLTFTSKSGNVLNGVSTTGQYGTTAATTGIGSTVTSLVLLEGHPLDILRRLLVSTAAGTNGSWDVYPASWGLKFPEGYVDVTDIGTWKTSVVTPATGSHSWDLILQEPVQNPWAWIQDIWSKAGIALVMFEGKISVRCAQDYDAGPSIGGPYDVVSADVRRLSSLEYWSGTQLVEYDGLEGTIDDGVVGPAIVRDFSPIKTTPTAEDLTFTMSHSTLDPLGNGSMVWSNHVAVCTEVVDRRDEWVHIIPEKVRVDLGRWEAAQCCPGDRMELTTNTGFSIQDAGGSGTFTTDDVLCIAGPTLDWTRTGVQITVIHPI